MMETEGAMFETTLTCDYLVVGAGPQGLAFTDALIAESTDCTVIVVDRRDRPGGRWTDCYAFARLSQPSVYSGVSSRKLESSVLGGRPRSLSNGHRSCPAGFIEVEAERATRDEILTYYDQVMEDLLRTGRVRYFPMCRFDGRRCRVVSNLDIGREWEVRVQQKLINATFLRIPGLSRLRAKSEQPWAFRVDSGVLMTTPEHLPNIGTPYKRFVVVGGGHTGVETVLWLLSKNVAPNKICWIVSREPWFCRREAIQPSMVPATLATFSRVFVTSSFSVDMVCDALEEEGILCRLDPGLRPQIFHGEIVSFLELDQLRRVHADGCVVRMGRVRAATSELLHLEGGSVPTGPGTLHIDCASAGPRCARPPVPIFEKRLVTLQQVGETSFGVGEFNLSFSAALIGILEAWYPDSEEMKNSMCTPLASPDTSADWLKGHLLSLKNRSLWADLRVARWMVSHRPGRFASVRPDLLRQHTLACKRPSQETALHNLERLLMIEATSSGRPYFPWPLLPMPSYMWPPRPTSRLANDEDDEDEPYWRFRTYASDQRSWNSTWNQAIELVKETALLNSNVVAWNLLVLPLLETTCWTLFAGFACLQEGLHLIVKDGVLSLSGSNKDAIQEDCKMSTSANVQVQGSTSIACNV